MKYRSEGEVKKHFGITEIPKSDFSYLPNGKKYGWDWWLWWYGLSELDKGIYNDIEF